MRFLFLIVALLSSTKTIRAISSKIDKFHEHQARSTAFAPIQLDDSAYNDITSTPRDYHLVILLTALDARYGCQLCREFQEEWDILARSWNKAATTNSTKLLFATLDFTHGKNTFHKLMLQTAPLVLLFPPSASASSKAANPPHRYDFTGPVSAEHLYMWISRFLPDGPKPPIVRPINYGRAAGFATVLLGVISLITVSSAYILPVIRSRSLWTAISLVSILLFTSGHMFNHIRKVPYITGDGKGGINYFAPGFSTQFGLESQIIAAIYGVLSLATIALVMKIPRATDATMQRMGVILWSTVLWGMYSFLVSVFRSKNGGYPLSLPPF